MFLPKYPCSLPHVFVLLTYSLIGLTVQAVTANNLEEAVEGMKTVPQGDVSALIDAIEDANENPGEPVVIELSGTYTLSPDADDRIPFWHEGNTGLPAIQSEITIKAAEGEEAKIQRDPELECELNETSTDEKFRILTVGDGAALTLERLTVSHGCADDALADNRAGGGLLNSGGSVEIISSTISENSAGFSGGGIHHTGVEAELIESSISNNTANGRGGGIRSTSDMVISDSEISDNTSGNTGGGIENSGYLRMTESAVVGNMGERNGGGIRTRHEDVVLTDSEVSSNVSGRHGGGLYVAFPSSVEITGTDILGNEADGDGGGIWNNGGLKITTSKISENEALGVDPRDDGDGGGIHNVRPLEIEESTVANNTAAGDGGGLFSNSGDDNTVLRTTIAYNTAGNAGGGIANRDRIHISTSTIANNEAANMGGGFLNTSGSEATIVASTFARNEAIRAGGILNLTDATISIKSSIVADSPSGGECDNEGDFTGFGTNMSNDDTCPGFRFSDTDPQLDPGGLDDHGGPTETIALSAESPAINAADDCNDLDGEPLGTDQRGVERPDGGACDLGAFEYDGTTEVVVVLDVTVHPGSATIEPGETVFLRADVEVDDPDAASEEDLAVEWSSSNKDVASVDEDGRVTGVSGGEAVITATSVADPSVSGSAEIEVHDVGRAPTLFVEAGEAESDPRETVIRKRVATIDFAFVERLIQGDEEEITLNLFEDVTPVVRANRVDRWSVSEYSWFGDFLEHVEGPFTIEVDVHEEKIFSSLQVDRRPYRIEHIEGGSYNILELDLSSLRDHPPDWEELDEEGTGSIRPGDRDTTNFGTSHTLRSREDYFKNVQSEEFATMASDNEIIDVLVVYNEAAQDSAGSFADMALRIRNVFNKTNTSFAESGVNVRVRNVATRSVTWEGSDAADLGDFLSSLRSAGNDSDHFLHDWREEYGADIVGMVVEGPGVEFCGRAYVMNTVSTDFRDKGYFVVRKGCFDNHSFAHEIGHVMSARHDLYVDDPLFFSAFDYNHGYVHIDGGTSGAIGWRTIMAYNDECDDENPDLDKEPWCPRQNRWSNPDKTWEGDPMGIASGSEAADNVRALNNTASTVSSFMDSAPIVHGTVTDLMSEQGLDSVEVAGLYGPVTDEDGFYDVVVRKGHSVQLNPKKGDYEFSPTPPKWINDVTSDQKQDFSAGIYHTLSGQVSKLEGGSPVEGVEMWGTPGTTRPTTDSDGYYDFDVLEGWSGTVTPKKEGYDFFPASTDYSSVTEDDQQNYQTALKQYTLSGSITDASSGAPIPDVTLQLETLGSSISTDETGTYSVTLEYGSTGTIIPRKPGYTFEPFSQNYNDLEEDLEYDFIGFENALARSSWPLFGGNQQHQRAVRVSPIRDETRWKGALDGEGASPVIGSGGSVYVGASNGSLYAFDTDGNLLWQTKSAGSEIQAAPAAASGQRVYVPFTDGTISSIDHTGGFEWSFMANAGVYSAPNVGDDGVIYVGADDDSLYAIAPEGSKKWAFGTGGAVRSSPALDEEGTIYVGSDDGKLYAISSEGTEKWSFSTGDAIRSSPAVGPNGTIYVGSDDGALYAVSSEGLEEWSFSTGGAVRSSPGIDSDWNVYVGSYDGKFYALRPNGSKLWEYETNGAITSSPAIDDKNGIVYFGSEDGDVYSLRTSIGIEEGTTELLRWRYSTGEPVFTSPALAEEGLYISSGIGDLLAFEVQEEPGAGKSESQFTIATLDPVFELLEEAHIIVWLSEQGGPLGIESPVDPDDPCPSGPVYFPECPNTSSGFGATSPFVNVTAGDELVIGLASGGDLDAIAAGETTEGLLGTVQTKLEAGVQSTVVLGGLTDPEAFAENPDGRSTGLNAFTKTHDREEQLEDVSVYAGHFSTDSPELEINIIDNEGIEHTLSNMQYGEFSETTQIPPGVYDVTMNITEAAKAKKDLAEQTKTIDLRDSEGEIIGILAKGFLDPAENNNGPSLDMTVVSSEDSMPERPEPVVLVEPKDDEVVQTDSIQFVWNTSAPEVQEYQFQLSSDEEFTVIHTDSTLSDTTITADGLTDESDYWWRVRAHNEAGAGDFSESYSFTFMFTSAEQLAGIPDEYELSQNYPNPFNPVTVIEFALPEAGDVELIVYNILGREVATLVNERKQAGHHQVTFDAGHLASGVYIYHLRTDNFEQARQLTLIK